MKISKDDQPLMSMARAAGYLNMDYRTIRKAIQDGVIDSVQIGSRTLVISESLIRMIEPKN